MSERRKIRKVIQSLPNDCWCHIITYIGKAKDFLSIVLAAGKTLLPYIQLIYPRCTVNLRFVIRRVPSLILPHVSNVHLECSGHMDTTEEVVGMINESGFGKFVEGFLTKFPNAEVIVFNFVNQFDNPTEVNIFGLFQEWPVPQFNLSFQMTNVCNSLKRFGIVVTERNLTIDQTFPKLYQMSMINYTRTFDNPTELKISFAKLPNLTEFKAIGFKMIDSMEEVQDRLEVLVFGSETDEKIKIANFKKLETLRIYSRGVRSFDLPKLKNPSIKRMTISTRWIVKERMKKFYFPPRRSIPHAISCIQNLQNLEKFRFGNNVRGTISVCGIRLDRSTTLHLKKLPNLVDVVIKNCNIPIVLSETPKIRKIVVLKCRGLVSIPKKEDHKNLQYVEYWRASMDEQHRQFIQTFLEGRLKVFRFRFLTSGFNYEKIVEIPKVSNNELIEVISLSQMDLIRILEVSKCPKLRYLSLHIGPDQTIKISELPALVTLHFRFFEHPVVPAYIWDEIGSVQNDGLKLIVSGNAPITPLPFEETWKVSILRWGLSENLIYDGRNEANLSVVECVNVGNVVLTNCPKLTRLSLDITSTNSSLEVKDCPVLQDITLYYRRRSMGITELCHYNMAIGEGCGNLNFVKLNISGKMMLGEWVFNKVSGIEMEHIFVEEDNENWTYDKFLEKQGVYSKPENFDRGM